MVVGLCAVGFVLLFGGDGVPDAAHGSVHPGHMGASEVGAADFVRIEVID